jgi:succinate-acetate transporter protein
MSERFLGKSLEQGGISRASRLHLYHHKMTPFTMKTFLKYYPFWLGLLVLIILNSFSIIRQAPSMGMIIMYLIGYFQLTKIHD